MIVTSSLVRLLILVACCGPLAGLAPADALDKSFSSLCTEADSGDISGVRIKITGTPPDLTLSYEEPEGAIVATTTTKDVSYVPATGALGFKLATDAGPLSFTGHASDTQLEGTLKREDGTEEALRLSLDKGDEGDNACPGASLPAKPGPAPDTKP